MYFGTIFERERAKPTPPAPNPPTSILLPTYESERRGIGEALLKFDKMYSGMFSGRAPPDATELANEKPKAAVAVDAQKFIE